jgi:hypothetical protein
MSRWYLYLKQIRPKVKEMAQIKAILEVWITYKGHFLIQALKCPL